MKKLVRKFKGMQTARWKAKNNKSNPLAGCKIDGNEINLRYQVLCVDMRFEVNQSFEDFNLAFLGGQMQQGAFAICLIRLSDGALIARLSEIGSHRGRIAAHDETTHVLEQSILSAQQIKQITLCK